MLLLSTSMLSVTLKLFQSMGLHFLHSYEHLCQRRLILTVKYQLGIVKNVCLLRFEGEQIFLILLDIFPPFSQTFLSFLFSNFAVDQFLSL